MYVVVAPTQHSRIFSSSVQGSARAADFLKGRTIFLIIIHLFIAKLA
jgi:hypothetical protein